MTKPARVVSIAPATVKTANRDTSRLRVVIRVTMATTHRETASASGVPEASDVWRS